MHDLPNNLPSYAELHCLSNFSFQRGASHPHELACRSYDLGYEALAITDECSVAGVVRAWSGLRSHLASLAAPNQTPDQTQTQTLTRPFHLLYGSEFHLGDPGTASSASSNANIDGCAGGWPAGPGGRLVAIARHLQGWGGLCEFITAARMQADKGHYLLDPARLPLLDGCELLYAPQRVALCADSLAAHLDAALGTLLPLLPHPPWLAVELPQRIDDGLWLAALRSAGARHGLRLVASGNVHMHARSRKPLQDVVTAVRLGRTVAQCGFALQVNAERRLRPRLRLAGLFAPDLLAATLQVAQQCHFKLEEIRYDYPLETVPAGLTPTQGLAQLTWAGAAERYPGGVPQKVRDLLCKELDLITLCCYEMFFLTVHDIVRFARGRGILCQGRGSAANSVVCYCLGITAMDPMDSEPLLERFISVDRRNEPPDIDVDFEHERREEVIQYIYAKYGRDRAALAATVIRWRARSAIRDVGKALAVPPALVDAFAKDHHWFDAVNVDVEVGVEVGAQAGAGHSALEHLAALAVTLGVDLPLHQARLWLALSQGLMGCPRHLSQHVGGFVLTQTRLTRLVPVENASMPDRSVIQWDKDDLEDMGLMKVDVLALGMLTAIRRCVDFVGAKLGQPFSVHDISANDGPTYEMIRRADTVGVFQIESRAQMSMLPRLKPNCFYDLVVEVAIVRPGPISGGMVHPYLKARSRVAQGLPIEYERSSLEQPGEPARLQLALQRTLGIPIFQEQVMQISMVAAGFTATQADALRRAMAAWKRKGGLGAFHNKFIKGMLANGYQQNFAERIFEQIKGFGEYGFPESHAYSFALLAYQSSWLKSNHPDCFLAAMLNSQPMGFYGPSQLIQDAQRHGVQVLPADVSHSDWDCTLQEGVVRLGLRLVGSLAEASAHRIVAARGQGAGVGSVAFVDVQDLALRAQLDVKDVNALASADALKSLAGHRRQQVWQAAARHRAPALLQAAPVQEDLLTLPAAPQGEEILFDYRAMGLSLRAHPLALLRARLARSKLQSAAQLYQLAHGAPAAACGLVTMRQQPQTAKGTLFVTLEDETGNVNVIVWKHVREAQREPLLRARLLAVRGVWQRDEDSGGQVCHLVARRLTDLTPLLGRLGELPSRSRDFH